MNRQSVFYTLLILLGLFLPACNFTSQEDAVATAVAATLAAQAPSPLPPTLPPFTSTPSPVPVETVIATPLPTSTPIPLATLPPPVIIPPTPLPSSTPLPPPPPTPTRPVYEVVEVDGNDGNQDLRGSQPINDGRYIILPGYAPGSIDQFDPIFHDKLVFQVEVFDTANGGFRDGDGIQNVRFTITKDGDIVYEKTENTLGYCVFGGGEPDCGVWFFAEHDYRWPEPYAHNLIEDGSYNVAIVITPYQGETAQWNWNFEIQGVSFESQPEPSNLTAEIIQTGPNTDSDVVSDALVFQVFASANGNNDGAGIDRVDMRIIGPNGEVYQRTEQNAGYCAFSGGEPDCQIWYFAEHNNRWPNGDPIEPGNYTLRAIVYAKDDTSITVEKTIQIQ